ncbi:Uncharacterised protein [Cedecea neteri]|uniref:Bacterial Ig-like domain-containing protein n=1 Tax=Cedecea neteri TaxID=158822 RepID=A0A2X3J8Q1_9ENTR|nr:Uncharacterised protein [Cedecea neteri]
MWGTVTGPVSNNGATNDPTPTLSGSGEPGSTITVYDGLNVLGTTTVNGNGTWTFTPTTPLLDGPHSFTVTASDAAGNVTAPSAPWNVELLTVLPNAPTIGEIIDNVSPDLGPVLPGGSTNDPQPVINGQQVLMRSSRYTMAQRLSVPSRQTAAARGHSDQLSR